MKNKHLLISGGTGFIGYHLANFAIKKGWKVVSISSKRPSKNRKVKKVKYLLCDINNKKKIKNIANLNFDYVVNLSGYVDHSNKSKTYKTHYLGCKNLANAFLNNEKIVSFVQLGSSLEYGNLNRKHKENMKCNPVSIYAKSKYYSTKYLLNLSKKYNFPTTVIRLYQSYGEFQDFNRLIPFVIKNCLKKKKFECSPGNQIRDFIHVSDVIGAIYKSLTTRKARGQIINIGSGKGFKIKEIILMIKNLTKGGTPIFGAISLRPDESNTVIPNIKKAKGLISWYPKIKLDNGLKKTIKYYKKIFNL